MSNISTSSQLQFTNGLLNDILKPNPINIIGLGDNYVKQSLLVDSTGTTLDLGAIGNIGWIMLQNTMTAESPPSPVPVITHGGTPGTNNDSYAVVAHFPDGSLSVGTATTATAAARKGCRGTSGR